MSAIGITVEAKLGRSVLEVIEGMVAVSRRLDVDVWCRVNEVKVLVRPGDAAQATYIAWEKAMRDGHRIAAAIQDHKTRTPA